MGFFIFWGVILLLVLGLIGTIISTAHIWIPLLIHKIFTTATEKTDQNLETEYRSNVVGDGALQGRLTMIFVIQWALILIGVFLMAGPATLFIQAGGTVYLDVGLKYALSIFVGFWLIVISRYLNKTRAKRLSTLIAEPIIREVFGADADYTPFGSIPDACIRSSGFVGDFDSNSGSDFVKGHYRDIPIMFSDVHLTKEETYYDDEAKKERKRNATVFRGYWLVADFDRDLAPVPLSVREGRKKGRDAIKMESEAFNRQFGVYCENPHTAFYVLTPHFMERLVEIDRAANGTSSFRFEKNRLQMAVGTRSNKFESGLFRLPNVKEMRGAFKKDVEQLMEVLDETLKHERLFGSHPPQDELRKELTQ